MVGLGCSAGQTIVPKQRESTISLLGNFGNGCVNMKNNFSGRYTFLAIIILAVSCFGAGVHPGHAQSSGDAAPQVQAAKPVEGSVVLPPLATKEKVSLSHIEGWNIDLEGMAKAIARAGIRDQDFEQLHNDALVIQNDSVKLIGEISPKLNSLRERFAQLGPLPAEGQPKESDVIASKREALSKEIANSDGTVKAAQLVIVKARQIRDQIVEARRSRFVKSVTSKSYSILDPDLWAPAGKDIRFFGKGFGILISNIFTANSNRLAESSDSNIGALIGSVLILLILLVLAKKTHARMKVKLGDVETDRSLRAVNAFLHIVEFGVFPAAFVLGVLAVLNGFELLSGNKSFFVNGVAFALAIAIMVRAIAFSFIRPSNEALRLVELNDLAANRVYKVISLAILVFMVSWFTYDAGRAMVSSFEFGIIIKALFALIIAVLTGVVLRLINLGQDEDETSHAGGGLSIFLNWTVLRAAVSFGVLIIFVSLLTGYISLAEFAANQIILSSTILAMLWLLLKIIDDVVVGCFQTSHSVNQSISSYLGWKRKFTEQIGVVLTGLLRLSVIIISLLGLLIPWGFRARDWVEWISAAFFGFQVGDITISISVILSAMVVFFIGLIITRSMRRWLSMRFLPTTRLDAGIQNSISTVFGYIGITTAVAVTVSYAGFDLTSLAFVAGALSVGIGFGLQSVVSNFVSGLILLVERPIKAGDWVVTSGGEGTVRKISVRSTEIQTFDRSTVILPNSTLITESVVNWNHKSSMGRIKLPIGVGYDSDPQRVREVLFECAEAHVGILNSPAPIVYFMEFGASSLDFELRCYLADVGNGMSVKSDLRYAIFAALNKEGISIPFPQSDVHIKGLGQVSEELKTKLVEKSKAETHISDAGSQKNIRDDE